MSSVPITEQDARKPDPDEPWRYVCPRCFNQVDGRDRAKHGYRCRSCNRMWPYEQLYDKKTEGITSYE